MAEEGCKTPGQMLMYMNKATQELHGKDLKSFLESERKAREDGIKTAEESANSIAVIHNEAEEGCNKMAADLKAMEEEDHPMMTILTAKKDELKNVLKDKLETLKVPSMPNIPNMGMKEKMSSLFPSKEKPVQPTTEGGKRKSKKNKSKKNKSKKSKKSKK